MVMFGDDDFSTVGRNRDQDEKLCAFSKVYAIYAQGGTPYITVLQPIRVKVKLIELFKSSNTVEEKLCA